MRLKRRRGDDHVLGVTAQQPENLQNMYQSFNKMREKGLFVDVLFRVEEQTFPAHRCILASQSAPFSVMFANGMKETGNFEITLNDTDPEAFALLLDYMYLQPIQIRARQVLSLLAICSKWEVEALKRECYRVLGSALNSESCWDILNASDAYGCEEIRQRTLSYVFSHFESVVKVPRFTSVSLPLLKEIVSSDKLWRVDESTIFNACARWIQASPDRTASAVQILKNVRFVLINPLQLVKEIKSHPVMRFPETVQLYHAATEHLALVYGKMEKLEDISRRCSGAKVVNQCKHESEGTVYSITVYRNLLIAGYEQGTICVWDPETLECEREIHAHEKAVGTMVVLDNKLIAGSHDRCISVWNIDTWELEKRIMGHSQGVWALVVVGQNLISASYDSTIKVWNVSTWECERTIHAHADEIETIEIFGDMLISASDDKLIKVWNLNTWECEHELQGHTDAVMRLKVADGKLISSSQDGTIRIWDLDTWTCESILEHHSDSVRTFVVVSHKLISGAVDGKIVMWSMDTWTPEQVLAQDTDEVEVLEIVDGSLISGSAGGIIRKWDLL
eukprot:c6704_g1_i1.p1 GENE.c6704_g1_i1~~c6704_g1_i1.p1  ORF type:complete len:564 (+),score=119.98 c6704_g1_i1:41-1732(+)